MDDARHPETDWPRWPRWFQWVVNCHLFDGLCIAFALIGVALPSKVLLWTGLAGLAVYIGLGVVYGLVMGVYVHLHTFRKWSKYPPAGKFVLGCASLVILILLGGIAYAAWIRFNGG